jgi:DNA invertase Pin-like site-specific DNA recombinase
MHRAAQYVRMSTDYQQYSIENQAVVIATYAELHKLTIVRTYRDEGESGLKIENRAGLTELIDDVRSGQTDFGHLLVFDVSRWGRFQDIDESAHYEFICRKGGIKVAYCAEQFDNDGSLLSSIVKNIKRVMAAEFSRELSAKVLAGALRLAGHGFKMGGPAPYGLQRLVVDDHSHPKGYLKRGERKFLITDRVRLGLGPADQVEVVKWIFEEYIYRLIGYTANQNYWDELAAHKRWVDLLLENAERLREAFEKAGKHATLDASTECLRINNGVNISFRVAKWRKHKRRPIRWTLRRRARWPKGWVVAARLGENSATILDYVLLPSVSLSFTGPFFWFSEKTRAAHKIERFESFEELSQTLIKRVCKATRGVRGCADKCNRRV